MMKTLHLRRSILLYALLAVVLMSGCVAVAPIASASDAVTEPQPASTSETIAVEAGAAETDALIYMREEEKLAHDVYVELYAKWGLPIFDNIARAESQHMSMVLQVLDARGLTDPAAGNGPGEFTNSELQALYDSLVAQGEESVVEALVVGATIEDVDIADLQESLATTTDEDIQWIFGNLLRGSENHMRAFVRNLDRYGENYEPQYIDAAYFESIVENDGIARGQQMGRGQGRGGRWQR